MNASLVEIFKSKFLLVMTSAPPTISKEVLVQHMIAKTLIDK